MMTMNLFGKHHREKYLLSIILLQFVLPIFEPTACLRLDASDFPDPFSEEKCNAYLNEINLSASEDTSQFIEIMIYCRQPLDYCLSIDMGNFLLLFMNPMGMLVGVCQLKGVIDIQTQSESYYTIGKIQNGSLVDFDIESCVLSSSETPRNFPEGKTVPYGLALTYISRSSRQYYRGKFFPFVNHFRNFMYETTITSEIEDMIMSQTQDFIVYASTSLTTFCDNYQRFYTGYTITTNPTLRDWNIRGSKDRSISRCTSSALPFQAANMKYSNPTPGKKNACSTAFSHKFEEYRYINNFQKAIFTNDSSGCYSFNYDSFTTFQNHLFSSARHFFQELDVAENRTVSNIISNFTNNANTLDITNYNINVTSECKWVVEREVNDDIGGNSIAYLPNLTVPISESCLVCQTCVKGRFIHNYFLNKVDDQESNGSLSRRRRHKDSKEMCKTQFSELNTMTPFSGSDEFIEIRRICGPRGFVKNSKYVLDDYILLFIEILETPQIKFIAYLGGMQLLPKPNKYSSNKIYISTLGNKQYSSDTWLFQNRQDVQYSSPDRNNIIPDGTDSVVLAVLLFSKGASRPYNTFKLLKDPITQTFAPLLLTQDMKSLIKLYVVDIIAYAANPKYSNCELIHQLSNQFSTPNFILRDWNQRGIASHDYSIGRCGTEINSFSPESFKIGIPSPNAVNDCETSVAFLLNKDLNKLAQFLPSNSDEDFQDTVSCSLNPLDNPILAVSPEDYNSAIEAKRAKYELSMMQVLEPSSTSIALETLPGLDEFVRDWNEDMKTNPLGETKFPWESDKYYDASWTEHVRREMSDILDPQLISRQDVKSWIQMLPGNRNNNWRYNCRFCSNFFDNNNRLDRRGSMRRKPIMETGGTLEIGQGAFSKNSKNIEDHLFSEIHFQAIEYLQERHVNMFEDDESTPKKDRYFVTAIQDEYFRSTINIFRIVFFRIKYNIPCNVYPSMIDLFKFFDINVGHKHYDEKNCGLITRHIGAEMHNRLVTHLVKTKKPFTVLIDAASVGPKHHFLLFMIRTIEHAEPVTYLYRLIEIGSKSTAQGTWEAMQHAIEADGNVFVSFFKTNAVGLASDGASVNLGIRNSIMTRFKSYLHDKIPVFHCISHKNQLIYRNVVTRKNDNALYVHKLEGVLNHLHSFYSIRSYKRNANLREFVASMNKVAKESEESIPQPIKYIQLKRIFEVRWATSQAKVLEAFFLMYEYVMQDLWKIVRNKKESPGAIQKASELVEYLVDRTCLRTLALLYDVTFSKFSLDSQKHDKVVIGVANSITKLRQGLVHLKTHSGGTHSQNFLKDVFCESYPQGTCTDALFKSSWRVRYKGNIMYNVMHPSTPNFQIFADGLFNDLIIELDKQFDIRLYSVYDILDPHNMPVLQNPDNNGVSQNQLEIQKYGVAEFIHIAKSFGLVQNQNDMKLSWNKLLSSILCLPIYERIKTDEPSLFWKKMLSLYPLEWDAISRRVVEGTLSLSVSTAIVESTFSIAEHVISDKRRGNLGPDTIESMLRVRVNARVHWSEWNPVDYVKSWLTSHLRTDHETHVNPHARYAKNPDEETFKEFKPSSIF